MVTWWTGIADSIMFSFFCKLANILNKNWVPDDCFAANWGTNFLYDLLKGLWGSLPARVSNKILMSN